PGRCARPCVRRARVVSSLRVDSPPLIPEPVRTRRFQIGRVLGSGSMGVVYEALDIERGGRVALKTLRTLEAESLLRLKNEFRRLQDIHHPNLVRLGELLEEEGRLYFTMELVEGTNLMAYVRPGASVVTRRGALRQVGRAAEAPWLRRH